MKKVYDIHVHYTFEIPLSETVEIFKEEFLKTGTEKYCFLSVPHHANNGVVDFDEIHNLKGLYLKKHFGESAYAFAHLEHILPHSDVLASSESFLSQAKTYLSRGYDGIKMLEGKPTLHRAVGKNLLHPEYKKFFKEAEKRGTHITFHINDPKEFWTTEGLDYYGDDSFASYEEIYRQAYEIFENYPNLTVTLAHFFFMSQNPEELARLFEKYPNMCVDITPGWEMYLSFYEKKEYFKEFFEKYSKRIILGTDAFFPRPTECNMWLVDRVYRFLASPDVIKAVADRYEGGMCISDSAIEDITYKNFERRVGTEPKPINKEALLKYYQKYKHLMHKDDIAYTDEVLKKIL